MQDNSKLRRLTLGKHERIRQNRTFQDLFQLNQQVVVKGVRFLYMFPGLEGGHDVANPKVGFVVGKKVHRKATQRNLIKRKLREAYRVNKFILYPLRVLVLINYTNKHIPSHKFLLEVVHEGLLQIQQIHQKENGIVVC